MMLRTGTPTRRRTNETVRLGRRRKQFVTMLCLAVAACSDRTVEPSSPNIGPPISASSRSNDVVSPVVLRARDEVRAIALEIARSTTTREGRLLVFSSLRQSKQNREHAVFTAAERQVVVQPDADAARAGSQIPDVIASLVDRAGVRGVYGIGVSMPIAAQRNRWRAGEQVDIAYVDPSDQSVRRIQADGREVLIDRKTEPTGSTLVVQALSAHQLTAEPLMMAAECGDADAAALGSLCVPGDPPRVRPAIEEDPCDTNPYGDGCTPPPPPPPLPRPAPGMYLRRVSLQWANVCDGWPCFEGSEPMALHVFVPAFPNQWVPSSATCRGAERAPLSPTGRRNHFADMWGNNFSSGYGSSNALILSQAELDSIRAFYADTVARVHLELWSDPRKVLLYPLGNCSLEPGYKSTANKLVTDAVSGGLAAYYFVKIPTMSLSAFVGLTSYLLKLDGPSYDTPYGALVLEDSTRYPTQHGYAQVYKVYTELVRYGFWIETNAPVVNGTAEIEVIPPP